MEEQKKAKLRAMHLLERMDRTEGELREKLQKNYEPEIVEEAIAYVKSYGYIDDRRYVKNYIEYKSDKKSRRQIEQELIYRKGVPGELVRQVYEELEPRDETILIRRWMEKKKFNPETAEREEMQKFYHFLMRKGFSYEDIQRVLRNCV